MTLLQRILREKRPIIVPLVVALVVNVAAYVLAVRPLGVRSANEATHARGAAENLKAAIVTSLAELLGMRSARLQFSAHGLNLVGRIHTARAPILFVLAVAGAFAGKRVTPAGLGTLRTDNPTFVVLLIGVIVLVGALTFFPALLLGPVVQGLTAHLY